MLTAKEFFTASGLTTEHKQIKLVKHVDHADRSIREIVDAGYFDAYQAEQGGGKRPFDNCEVIISFIALQNNLAEFLGVYRVLGSRLYTRKDCCRVSWPPEDSEIVMAIGRYGTNLKS